MERPRGGRQRVEAPEALLPAPDEPRAAEVGEVARRLGLGQAVDPDQVAHAELPALEEAQDPEPRGIREGAEEPVGNGVYIFVYTDIIANPRPRRMSRRWHAPTERLSYNIPLS